MRNLNNPWQFVFFYIVSAVLLILVSVIYSI